MHVDVSVDIVVCVHECALVHMCMLVSVHMSVCGGVCGRGVCTCVKLNHGSSIGRSP
jgi:hypothetical protein